MCVYLYKHNKYTQYTHIYYVNKNFYLELYFLFYNLIKTTYTY